MELGGGVAAKAGGGEEEVVQVWSEVNKERKEALQAWMEETGIRLVQVNGQRKYGGPPPGSEVFIGKIPQHIYEDKLIPVFASLGNLYEFRLMMTFSGLNRGFAYAKYANRCSAQKAIDRLNGLEIEPGHPIVVCRSTEKCELSIDGLALCVRRRPLLQLLCELTAGVTNISLRLSPVQRGKQMAEVKYDSHSAAAMAKKVLVEGSLCLCGDQIQVDWLKQNKQEFHPAQASPEILPSICPAEDVSIRGASRSVDCGAPLTVDHALAYLNVQCEERQLGSPVFLTKCVKRKPGGRLQYWYQVVIPRCPTPFSGLVWIQQENTVMEDHKKAKNTIALHLLKFLGKRHVRAEWCEAPPGYMNSQQD